MNEENPFASPQTVSSPAEASEFESIRLRYLSHESSLRVLGVFNALAGALLGIILFWFFSSLQAHMSKLHMAIPGPTLLITLIGIIIAIAQIISGVQLVKLAPNTKVPSVLIALVMLVLIPIGTVFGFASLVLLGNNDTEIVLSRSYRQTVESTPQIRPYVVTKWVVFTSVAVTLIVVGVFSLIAWLSTHVYTGPG